MTLKECYDTMGGDYEGVFARLRSEKFLKKFVTKFLTDKSYNNICTALENKDFEEAFRASHTLKGVCQNLGFDRLYKSSHDLTEIFRAGKDNPDSIDTNSLNKLMKQVTEDYEITVSAIKNLDE